MQPVLVISVLLLVFAFVFACMEAYKGSTGIRPTNFGWAAIALLILGDIFFRGPGLWK